MKSPEQLKMEAKESARAKQKAKDNMFLTGGQAKIAKKAPPFNKINAKDFEVLRAEKAKGRGMGLQDEKVKPGKVMKAKRGTGVLTEKGTSKTFKGFSKPFEGPQVKGKVSTIVGVKPFAKIKGQRKKFKSLEEMRQAKGFKPGESVSSFNKRRMELARAKDAAKALGPRGKIALGVGLAGVGAIQYLKSKMKKKKDEPKKKMGGGMMKKYNRGGMYLEDEKIKRVFPKKDAKRRAIISQLVGGDRVSPMKKERFTAGQRARRRDMLKKIGQGAIKTTPLGLGMKVAETAKKLKEKITSRVSGGPASEARQRKKNLEETVQKAAVSNIFSNFRKGAKKAEKKYASIPSGMKKDRDTDTKIKLNLLKSSRKDPFKELDDTRREVFATERMGGGMMNKPMGYKSGTSVKVKCKLGRNKPTKMY
jgi:hypothetical protein